MGTTGISPKRRHSWKHSLLRALRPRSVAEPKGRQTQELSSRGTVYRTATSRPSQILRKRWNREECSQSPVGLFQNEDKWGVSLASYLSLTYFISTFDITPNLYFFTFIPNLYLSIYLLFICYLSTYATDLLIGVK